MKKIAVIGAGITGISAVLWMNKLGIKPEQITVFTKDIGGDYTKGGLKYISYTNETYTFINKILNLDFSVHRINGAVFWDSLVHPFPEYFWYDNELGVEIQRQYWMKTRGGVDGYDTRCMNEPWNYKNQLKIVPSIGIKGMMQQMIDKFMTSCTWYDKQIDWEMMEQVINKYDLVIYTIPVHPLFTLLSVKPEKELTNAKLTIHRFKLNTNRQIWWEYMYVPQLGYPFHRLDIIQNNGINVDVEMNNVNIDLMETFYHLNKIMKTLFHGDVVIYNNNKSSNIINIKGQIKYDLSDKDIIEKIPKNVMLLGRYAEWNKRITWDKVLSKLMKTDFNQFVY